MSENLPIPERPLAVAKDMLDLWTQEADGLARTGDWEALGDGLGRLRALLKQLRTLEHHVEDHVAALMPSKRVVVPGLGLERRTSNDRRAWQSEAILAELHAQSFADENGVPRTVGEAHEVFYEAIKECVPLTGSLGWRVKALADYGINAEEYADVTPGRTSVQVWQPEEESDDRGA